MSNLGIRNRIWITLNDQSFLGNGRVLLLENIEREGSINKAAKAMGMSYKRAWQMVEAINGLANEPIVVRSVGGHGGGGTRLTEKGTKIVSEFKRIDNLCKELLNKELENCCF